MDECQSALPIGSPDSQSDSYSLKLGFTERALQRAKVQNARLNQQIIKCEKQIADWNDQKNRFVMKIEELSRDLQRVKKEKDGLIKQMEVRTHRHKAEQNQNITQSQKYQIQSKMKNLQQNAELFKLENAALLGKNQSLLKQLELQQQQKSDLFKKIYALQAKSIEEHSRIRELQGLYNQKIQILSQENKQLKKQIESLILQVKLFERKKQIQGLLNYESNIGIKKDPPKNHCRKGTASTAFDQNYLATFRSDLPYGNEQLQQQLQQREELIELLKERNLRLSIDLQNMRKRCSTLQGIICSSPI